jgi:Fur family transcriptional regulator, zinc uptake regulator
LEVASDDTSGGENGHVEALMPEGGLGAPFPSPSHDHGWCVEDAFVRARAAFERKGLKFTPLREQIFREIAASHSAIGAYEVRDKLTAKGARRLSPISVYRAIDALLYVGAISRFKSRNAYFACHNDNRSSSCVVLACQECGLVAEIDGARVFRAIERSAALEAFAPADAVIEVSGLCGNCAKPRASSKASRRFRGEAA